MKASRLGPVYLMKDGLMIPLKMMTKRHWNLETKAAKKSNNTKKNSKKNPSPKGDK